MPVAECQRRMSSSEFVMWQHYLAMEYNMPSRSDLYAAQTAMVTAQALAGSRGRPFRLSDFVLRFREPAGGGDSLSQQQREARFKASILAAFGVRPTRKERKNAQP